MYKKESFGLYIHIPFCVQICPYCPFAKYKIGTNLPKEQYLALLKQEIHYMAKKFHQKQPTSIYLGGGTPSILTPQEIIDLILELKRAGFCLNQCREITIEADPKTMQNPIEGFSSLKEGGVDRISLGVQTCNDRLLAQIGRTHRFIDTQAMVNALHQLDMNFSMDLLFALPSQTCKDLQTDVQTFLDCQPSHISTYLLEVSAQNKLSLDRPTEAVQAQMFEDIEDTLIKNGFDHYEISNYAKPGRESQHNLLYWNDQPYLGLGLAAHSYLTPDMLNSQWGVRCWNHRSLSKYKVWVESLYVHKSFDEVKSVKEKEYLEKHQSLTDFCHTQLRKSKGLHYQNLVSKYGSDVGEKVKKRCDVLKEEGLLDVQDFGVTLSKKGRLFSNKVFQELTFLKAEI